MLNVAACACLRKLSLKITINSRAKSTRELLFFYIDNREMLQIIITLLLLLILFFADFASCSREIREGGRDKRADLSETQREISREYKNLKLPEKPPTFNEFCYPHKFTLQNPQKFLAEYLAEPNETRALIGFHAMGAGKTCAAITASMRWIDKGKVLAAMPASLVSNFRAELRSECAGTRYMTREERKEYSRLAPESLRARELVAITNARIDRDYYIWSYNKFLTRARAHSLPRASFLILDEVHVINNPDNQIYPHILRYVEATARSMRVLLLSGTPIFDNFREIITLLRLARVDTSTIKGLANSVDELVEKLPPLLSNTISYYAGAPAHVYPRVELKYEICKMSAHQSRWFAREVEAEYNRLGNIKTIEVANSFYIKSRAKSNIVFPRGLSGSHGLPKLNTRASLKTYSAKFARLLKWLAREELSFVYTNFTSYGGIKALTYILRANGYKDYLTSGPGRKRYAIWSGAINPLRREEIRSAFNNALNDDGSHIQVIIGSPAIKEGVSLMRVRRVHMLEPYWNTARMTQVFARAVRFCSHKTLPRNERVVDIHLYSAVVASSKCPRNRGAYRVKTPLESVDLYILQLAEAKRALNDKVISTMINCAIDRGLMYGSRKKLNPI